MSFQSVAAYPYLSSPYQGMRTVPASVYGQPHMGSMPTVASALSYPATAWPATPPVVDLKIQANTEQAQCKPFLTQTDQDKLYQFLSPGLYWRLRSKSTPGKSIQTPEGPIQTIKMYQKVSKALDPKTRPLLKALMKNNQFLQRQADDGHSALYHLYGILTTPRGKGYDNKTILRETVSVLAEPAVISQRFAPLTPQATQQLMQIRNGTHFNGNPPLPPASFQDLNVESSATCVASSVMYYMARKEPADFTRHINELTSPTNAFWEKAKLTEISPDNPAQAITLLQEKKIPFYTSGPGEVAVKVINPPAGIARAIQSQQIESNSPYRNAIEAAYQSAVTYLATNSYDPATDMRDGDAPGTTSKGLTEPEKTLIEAIVKDNGGVQSITYQAVAGKASPAAGEEANSYLYGYNRSFEQIQSDLLAALRMNEPVIIGTTDTDETGAIVAGHEITITEAKQDAKTGQWIFKVADSDDGIPKLVYKTARELIPTIHHAGLPVALARKIQAEMQYNPGYLIPDAQDGLRYKLLAQETGPMPTEEASNQSAATPAVNTPGYYPDLQPYYGLNMTPTAHYYPATAVPIPQSFSRIA